MPTRRSPGRDQRDATRADTPNGLTDFLVVRAIQLLGEQAIEGLSLSFAAFARWLHSPTGRTERLLGRVLRQANPYFQLESLYCFNAKFFPRWQPRYLLHEGVAALPRTALAAMCGGTAAASGPPGPASAFPVRREATGAGVQRHLTPARRRQATCPGAR